MRELAAILRSGISLSRLIDPRGYLVFAPMLILTSTLSNARWDDPAGLGIWFGANLTALALMFLILSLIKRKLETLDTPVHAGVVAIFATGFAMGLFKTLLTLIPAQLLLDEGLTAQEILLRSLLVAPLGMTLVPVVVWMAVAKERYLANRDAVIAYRIANTGNSSEQGGATIRVQQELTAKIADEITRVRNKLFGGEAITPLLEQARELRNLAEYTVRPISHQIWQEQSKRVNDFSLRQLAVLGIRSTPFAPLIFILIVAPGLIFWAYGYLGIQSLGTKIFPALLITLVLQVALSKWKAEQLGGWLRFGLGIGLPALLGSVIIHFDILDSDPLLALTLFFTLTVWFFSTGILVAIFRAGIRARSDLDQELTEAFGSEAMERASLTSLSKFESRRIAQALHSNVQNKLLSTAMRLEQDSAPSRQELDAQLSLLENMVRQMGSASPAIPSRTVGESIEIATSDWKGFVEIQADGDLDQIPALGNEAFVQVLAEALGNAKRHGDATKVRISVTKTPDGLVLEIKDNGASEKTNEAGMGFALFRSISPTGFNFTSDKSGSTLTLVLSS